MQMNNIQGPKAPPPPPPPPPPKDKQAEAVTKAVKVAKQAAMQSDGLMGKSLGGAFGEVAGMEMKRKPVAGLPGIAVGSLRVAQNTRLALALANAAGKGPISLTNIFRGPAFAKPAGAFGRLTTGAGAALAPLQVVDGLATGRQGVDLIRDGHYLEGGARLAQGAASVAAGGAGALGGVGLAGRVLGLSSRATSFLGTAGRLAGPIGGIAAGIGGGIDVFKGLTSDPPDYKQAALGGANVIGGGLLAAGAFFPPLAVAGGLVLLGTAVIQNFDAIKNGVQAAGRAVAGAAREVGEAIADGASKVADTAKKVGETVADGAKAVGGAVVDGVKSVGKFLSGL